MVLISCFKCSCRVFKSTVTSQASYKGILSKEMDSQGWNPLFAKKGETPVAEWGVLL